MDIESSQQQMNNLFMLVVGDKKEMDKFFLMKFVKDFEINDEKVSQDEIEEIFKQLCLSQNTGKKSINFEEFQELLSQVAKKKEIPLDNLYEQIFKNTLSSKFTVGKARASLKSGFDVKLAHLLLGGEKIQQQSQQLAKTLTNSGERQEEPK